MAAWNEAPWGSGAYLLTNTHMSTKPLRLFVPHEDCARLIPDTYDGTDPMVEGLPWCKSVLYGIGVVVSPGGRDAILAGLSYMGKSSGWQKFEFKMLPGDEDEDIFPPTPKKPTPFSLYSFEGSLLEVTDGLPVVKIRRFNYLQPAPIELCEELGYILPPSGKARVVRSDKRWAAEQKRLDVLLNTTTNESTSSTQPSSSTSASTPAMDVTTPVVGEKRRRTD
ncbi:hypothetical protein OC834_006170 [Tilletia horrida]|nr:hypothetical protein OC834_006170 [Tilletia horrida]